MAFGTSTETTQYLKVKHHIPTYSERYLIQSQVSEKETIGNSSALVESGSYTKTLLAFITDMYRMKDALEIMNRVIMKYKKGTFDPLFTLTRATA